MKKHLKVILLLIFVTFLQTIYTYAYEDASVSGISYDEIYDPIKAIEDKISK